MIVNACHLVMKSAWIGPTFTHELLHVSMNQLSPKLQDTNSF